MRKVGFMSKFSKEINGAAKGFLIKDIVFCVKHEKYINSEYNKNSFNDNDDTDNITKMIKLIGLKLLVIIITIIEGVDGAEGC